MKILMATWEFPPYKVGGIASHCEDLSRALTQLGHAVHILTYGHEDSTSTNKDGVVVHRLHSTDKAPDTASWAQYLGLRMEQKAVSLFREHGGFDLVHAHDWMMVPAGVGIKKLLGIPLVFTLHSTEAGRSSIHDSYTKMINDLEWLGTFESAKTITVGADFCDEVRHLFNVPQEKIHYIPNGVDVSKFDKLKYFVDRNDYAASWEKIILFVGRLTHQKGLEFLLSAAPEVLKHHPEAKFVIAGGGDIDYYKSMAYRLGLGGKALFTGYVDQDFLPSLYSTADIVVAPSIYEPFGIVALESSAARKPIVGSYTGGLKETIIHEWNGLHTYPANWQSIAHQLNRVLSDDSWADWMGQNGRSRVEREYSWEKIAYWTIGVYGQVIGLW